MEVMGQRGSFHVYWIEVVVSKSIWDICVWGCFWEGWFGLLVIVVKWNLGIFGVGWWKCIWTSRFRSGYIDWRIVWHGCLVSVRKIVYVFAKLGCKRDRQLGQIAHVGYLFFQF